MAGWRARRGTAFTEAEREALLERYRQAFQAKERAELRSEPVPEEVRATLQEAGDAYVDGVPIMPVSRDPFSGAVFETSFDPFGIDGLWWAYDFEYRPWVEPPPTFFAWTGALKLQGPIPEWSLKAMVGPEVPFVLPRILGHPAVRAVVGALPVGSHQGYPIVYFAAPIPHDLERVDDWAHRSHTFVRQDGTPGSGHSVQDDEEKDFDLGPWLDRGDLLWIAPGDDSLTLRSGREGCPYVDLPGERRRRYVQEGDTWLA